jgi:hypothetical protein
LALYFLAVKSWAVLMPHCNFWAVFQYRFIYGRIFLFKGAFTVLFLAALFFNPFLTMTASSEREEPKHFFR